MYILKIGPKLILLCMDVDLQHFTSACTIKSLQEEENCQLTENLADFSPNKIDEEDNQLQVIRCGSQSNVKPIMMLQLK